MSSFSRLLLIPMFASLTTACLAPDAPTSESEAAGIEDTCPWHNYDAAGCAARSDCEWVPSTQLCRALPHDSCAPMSGDAAGCAARTDCAWSALDRTCRPRPGVCTPYDAAGCTNFSECRWSAQTQTCLPRSESVCEQLDANTCWWGPGCTWSYWTNECVAIACWYLDPYTCVLREDCAADDAVPLLYRAYGSYAYCRRAESECWENGPDACGLRQDCRFNWTSWACEPDYVPYG